MMRAALLAVLLLTAPSPGYAASDCREAIDEYNSALSDVSSTLRRYASCIQSSQGKDDCSSEFRRLKYAQGDLETAVSSISSYCND